MRLLPRFSLQFAWIALTIFLIVSGVVVSYWRAYQTHERIALQLQAIRCNVEEEPITLLGFVIGKRITGIEIAPPFGALAECDFEDGKNFEMLEQLPAPRDVRRFGINARDIDRQDLAQIFHVLERLPALELLYLEGIDFTEGQAKLLGRLPKLRVLHLNKCSLYKGAVRHWDRLPNLEKLSLIGMDFEFEEFLELNLPQLRAVELDDYPRVKLMLTKQGWGRFPQLETLMLNGHRLNQIITEPGALPRLKNLDLGPNSDGVVEVQWSNFAAALPELTLLAVPTDWLTPEAIPHLTLCEKLHYFYIEDDFDGTGLRRVQEFEPLDHAKYPSTVTERLLPALKEFLKKRPGVQFSCDYSAVIHKLATDSSTFCTPPKNMWPSHNWRPNPNDGGLF